MDYEARSQPKNYKVRIAVYFSQYFPHIIVIKLSKSYEVKEKIKFSSGVKCKGMWTH